MTPVIFLVLFPIAAACILLLVRNDRLRAAIVVLSAVAIAAVSIFVAVEYFGKGTTLFAMDPGSVGTIMMVAEVVFGIAVFYLGIKHKKYAASILALIQTPLIVWFELTSGHGIAVLNDLYIDELSVIMILIVGIIGSLICVYAIGYMRDFQKHHADGKDRRPWFFFLMFVFLAAMFGIVVSINLLWMFFFWEVTTLCSFLLIGYTKTEEATNNAFRQLSMNMLGGLAFAVAIVILGLNHGTMEFNVLISMSKSGIDLALPIVLLAFAGLVKAAQMPFHSWLLGAMVAPTPTSALLHSSTMVKAGVFMILKLSPVLGQNSVGTMVMIVGAVTFLLASMAAISQSNAKRVLAYSTIANLGLIVCCGGVGTYEAVWAGIMLTVFHAVTKSLLFLCVGTAEHHIGSRDIEDMDGLFNKMPRLASFMLIGMAGMFLAPFGMLISKWAAMTSFVDTGNIVLIVCICFGSAVTAFYWIKWMGKMVAIVSNAKRLEDKVHTEERSVLWTLAILVVAVCLTFPLLSEYIISPYLATAFGVVVGTVAPMFRSGDAYILLAMLALLLVAFATLLGRKEKPIHGNYMSGLNDGTDSSYHGSMGAEVSVSMRNWYMEDWFGEDKISKIGTVLTILTLAVGFVLIAAGVAI